MKPIDQMQNNPMVELLVDVLSTRTQNPDRNFFTILSCYHLTKLASMMRCTVDAKGMGNLLVNFYGMNLAPSGYGKGHANKIIEEQVIHLFRESFMEYTLPTVTDKSLVDLAIKRSQRKGTDDQEELEAVKGEFKKLGTYITGFDSGTSPALKQFRHQLLMSQIGSINFEADEAGSNLIGNTDIINTYLELYEGTVKPKLIKNTVDSSRNEEIIGKTPSNMLMFGTPTSLLDGSITERMFMDFLIIGYARRCFFGYSSIEPNNKKLTVQERLARLMDTSSDVKLANLALKLEKLADPVNHNFKVTIPAVVMSEIMEYQIHCEDIVDTFKTTDEIRRAEAKGRYYKTIKLAGAFAFLDSASDMTVDHWEAAVKISEMSAACFDEMLKTDSTHVRLAKYLSECSEPTTYADLVEELPFFPKASGAQKDLVKLAVAYGHKNNIIIKRSITDDIEFIQGETLQKTNLNQLILSWVKSDFLGVSDGFVPESRVPFDKLNVITQMDECHWCNHHFIDGKRKMDRTIRGFNLMVLDIDGTFPLAAAKELLKDYTYQIYTTKRHQLATDDKPASDRYRIVLPMSHILKLSVEEYKEFMTNVFEYLPFESDDATGQPNRKWLSNSNGSVFSNDGKLFDVLPFIPKTKKNEERKSFIDSTESMDKLERFFFNVSEQGNRNNTLFKYAAALLDAGYDLESIKTKLRDFNNKLPKPIDKERLEHTVIESVSRKFYSKG